MFEVYRQNNIKTINKKAVLNLIVSRKENLISRAEISRILNMSPTSISRIVKDLIRDNLIYERCVEEKKDVGRNALMLSINMSAMYTLGIAIDSTFINFSVVDFGGNTVFDETLHIKAEDYDVKELVEKSHTFFLEMCQKKGIDSSLISGLGVSCPGIINYKKGIVIFSPQLKWKQVNLVKFCTEKYGIYTYLDNDIKMALIGSVFRSFELLNSDVTYLSIGSGVGSAIMYGGQIVRGAQNAAGEIGHTLFSLNGRKCSCGSKGCLSPYISEHGLLEEAERRYGKTINMDEFVELFMKKDEIAIEIVEEITNYLVILINNVIYNFNTKYILIGGDLIQKLPVFEMAQEKLKKFKYHFKDFGINPILKKRDYFNNEALGAAYTVQDHLLDKMLES